MTGPRFDGIVFEAAVLIDFSRLLLLTFFELLRRAWAGVRLHLPLTATVLALPWRLAELQCAWRMELMVRRMRAMAQRIELVHRALLHDQNGPAIRGDTRFCAMLAVVRRDMAALQMEAKAWQRDRRAVPGIRLKAALDAVITVSGQVFGLADNLLRALDDSD